MTAALENVKSIDFEEWLTLNTAASPTKLRQGQTPNAFNVWVDEKPGSVISAPGYLKVGTSPSNNPCSFCINFFRTAAGTQTFVLSDNSTVWTTIDFQNFTSIITGLSSSFQLRGKVIRDKLWLTNGSDPVRVFDGTTVTVLDGSGGTPNVPKGRYIDYHDERVWLYHTTSNRSAAYFSALTDSSATIIAPDNVAAWPTDNFLQVSEGDADFGSGIILYGGYLYFFKQYSIWRLVGHDEYTYSRVKSRASTGTRFNESIQVLDNLIHFIGIDGIYVFDGDTTERISDIIDPATATQTAFGFNQIQQPNQNNQFWETTITADWNLGMVPSNILVGNQISMVAADETKGDFDSGSVLTNMDTATNPGILQLSRQASGGSNVKVGKGIGAYLDDSNNAQVVYGDPSYLTDGDTTRQTGLGLKRFSNNGFVVDLSADPTHYTNIGEIVLRGVQADKNITASIKVNVGAYQNKYASNGTWITVGTFQFAPSGNWAPYDVFASFASQLAIQAGISFADSSGSYQMSEIDVFGTAYALSGKFVSKPLNFLSVPISMGNFNANYAVNGEGITFFTQSSTDGISWDAEVPCTNGALVGSALKQYLRWGAYFTTSTGDFTPTVDSVWLSSIYVSPIHNTGGNIFAWGPFESDYANTGHAIFHYYRTATSSAAIPSQPWKLIVPGGVISDPVANQFVQFKIEMPNGDLDPVTGGLRLPSVTSVTINWVIGNATQASILQNVASTYWRNRYWLSATGKRGLYNDTILIRGKKDFHNPWQLKDWNILSFARFQDNLYGCSSIDGSIYRLDVGNSKNSLPMDCFFETGDFIFSGFNILPLEMLVEVERLGSYNMALGFSTDRGNTWTDYPVDLTVSSYAQSYIKKINLSTTNTDRIRFRVRTDSADQPFEVHSLRFFYTIDATRGSIR